jgi:hypothetical protein
MGQCARSKWGGCGSLLSDGVGDGLGGGLLPSISVGVGTGIPPVGSVGSPIGAVVVEVGIAGAAVFGVAGVVTAPVGLRVSASASGR